MRSREVLVNGLYRMKKLRMRERNGRCRIPARGRSDRRLVTHDDRAPFGNPAR
jgi:hypothetical protein